MTTQATVTKRTPRLITVRVIGTSNQPEARVAAWEAAGTTAVVRMAQRQQPKGWYLPEWTVTLRTPMARPPQGAALSEIRAWDRQQAADRQGRIEAREYAAQQAQAECLICSIRLDAALGDDMESLQCAECQAAQVCGAAYAPANPNATVAAWSCDQPKGHAGNHEAPEGDGLARVAWADPEADTVFVGAWCKVHGTFHVCAYAGGTRLGRCPSVYPGAASLNGRPIPCDELPRHEGRHGNAFAARYWDDPEPTGPVSKEQALHDHYARNALATGHAPDCQRVVGLWRTVDGVMVNWPTLNGRPSCTCGHDAPTGWTTGQDRSAERFPECPAWHDHPRMGLHPQDAPSPSRTAQDGRNDPDLTDWAPGEITEAWGR